VSADPNSDAFVAEIRDEINALDREILAAINRRLELVTQLHAYKTERGYPLVDRGREEALLAGLAAENPGPLSEAGLRELYGLLLAVLTREAAEQRSKATSPRRSPRD
jgi:chorismate mutase